MNINLPIRIFLSHPSDEDKEKVVKILKKYSPPVELEMFPNSKYEQFFTESIRDTIEEVDVLFAILNKNGRNSQWVNQEVGVAVAKEIDIVLLAEKEAILNGQIKLEGFISEKNKTIFDINKDDLEEDFLSWLEQYQGKHGIKIYQRLIIAALIKLKRVSDVQRVKYHEGKRQDISTSLERIEERINTILKEVRQEGFINTQQLKNLKDQINGAIDLISDRGGKTVVVNDKFYAAVENSKIILRIDEYINLRELET